MSRSTLALPLLLLVACSASKGDPAYDTVPTAAIVSPADRAAFTTAESVPLVGMVNDETTAVTDLVVSWESDGTDVLGADLRPDASGRVELDVVGLPVGSHEIELRVVDGSGQSGTDTVIIGVVAADTGGETGDSGETGGDTGHDTGDSGGDTGHDTGDSTGDTGHDTGDSGGDTAPDTGADTGGDTAHDTGGGTGDTAVDHPPHVEWTHPLDGERLREATPYDLVVIASDTEDAPEGLTVELSSDVDGAVCAGPADTAGELRCTATLSLGAHTLTATVTDTAGQAGAASVAIRVVSGDEIDDDGDGYTEAGGDCDDTSADVAPYTIEWCNGIDDNCDGAVDDATSADASVWHADADGDGYGAADDVVVACAAPAGYLADASDCDDTNGAVSPVGTEVCNESDDDCDGTVDEGVLVTFYTDADRDGYGVASPTVQACTAPDGYAATPTDCDDSVAGVNPGAREACNGRDDDCDATVDEPSADGCTTYYYDGDRDGYGSYSGACLCAPSGSYDSTTWTDCYDNNASANPANTAWWTTNRGDGSYDYNCDGAQTQQYTAVHTCSANWWGTGCASYTDGWDGAAPSCGANGSWRSGCEAYWWNCEATGETTITQSCR